MVYCKVYGKILSVVIKGTSEDRFMCELEKLKERLRKCERIIFNDPHFSNQLVLREGKVKDVEKCLKDPSNLVYFHKDKGKRGDWVYSLYFKISNTRTMKLPVIFAKKGLYILTYIMRHRSWQGMVKKK